MCCSQCAFYSQVVSLLFSPTDIVTPFCTRLSLVVWGTRSHTSPDICPCHTQQSTKDCMCVYMGGGGGGGGTNDMFLVGGGVCTNDIFFWGGGGGGLYKWRVSSSLGGGMYNLHVLVGEGGLYQLVLHFEKWWCRYKFKLLTSGHWHQLLYCFQFRHGGIGMGVVFLYLGMIVCIFCTISYINTK